MDFLKRISESLSVNTDPDQDNESPQNDRQLSSDSVEPNNRKSSFSNFDLDQTTPVSPSRIDPHTMFDELNPQTPAGLALKANKDLKFTRGEKIRNKIIKKRPKLKNFTKDMKKSRRRRRSHIKGKKIDGRHEQYTLSLGMMLGIRCCVGKSEQLQGSILGTDNFKLNFTDFMQVDKYVFPPQGNSKGPNITPPHQLAHTFKFKAYAPKIFSKIRTMFGVEAAHFMLSICGNYNFIEFISNAKSGQFFFYSHDGRYMIKTQTETESKFLRRIMPHYYAYLVKNPNTTLTHFYGMFRVKMNHLRRNVHFVIMKSVFNTDKRIDKVWDLKGSTVGRIAKPGETVFKDLDIVHEQFKMRMGPTKKEAFMKQLSNDVALLAKLEIMDYSLLLGLHDRKKTVAPTVHSTMNPEKISRSNTPLRRDRRDAPGGNPNVRFDDTKKSKKEKGKGGKNGANQPAPIPAKRQISSEPLNSIKEDDILGGGESGRDGRASSNGDFSDDGEYNTGEGEDDVSESEYSVEDDDDDDEDDEDDDDISPIKPSNLLARSAESNLMTEEEVSAVEAMKNGVHTSPCPWTDRMDGGTDAVVKKGEARPDEVYFFGIIDILQQYNTRKRAETFFKGFTQDSKEISCVDPELYGKRFLKFIDAAID